MYRGLVLKLIICLAVGKTYGQIVLGNGNSLLNLLKENVFQKLPASPDIDILEPFNITWKLPLNGYQFEGYFASEATKAVGINSIVEDSNVYWNSNTLSFRWNASIPKLELEGDYKTVQYCPWFYPDYDPQTYSGNDKYWLNLENFFVSIDFDFHAPLVGKMSLSNLDIHLHMNRDEGLFKFRLNNFHNESLEIVPDRVYDVIAGAGKLLFGDLSSSLDCFHHRIGRWFISYYIESTVNHLIGDCNIIELMLGGFECLRLTIPPLAFSPQDFRETIEGIFDCHYIGRKIEI